MQQTLNKPKNIKIAANIAILSITLSRCMSDEYLKQWKAENPEKVAGYQRKYRSTQEGKESNRSSSATYRENHSSTVKAYESSEDRKAAKARKARETRRRKAEINELIIIHQFIFIEWSCPSQLLDFYFKWWLWLGRDRRYDRQR